MRLANHRARALLAASAGALLLLEGLFVPMLDGMDGGHRPVLEREHAAATCLTGHDHKTCIQVGANQAISSGAVRVRMPAAAVADRSLSPAPRIPSATSNWTHGPRAPPAA